MKPITKYFLKIFLITGGIYSVINFLSDYSVDKKFDFLSILFNFLFFGLFMALIFTYLHKKELQKRGISEFTDENLNPNQQTEIISNLSINDLINKLKNDNNFKRINIKKTDKGLILKSGIKLNSWGENIEITASKNKNGKRILIISSKPTLKTTLVDYGQNKENIDKITKLIINVA